MSDSRSQWLLKVIAGPHQGAEIDLAPGKSLIGSDEGCDVVLHDVLIAPQHMAIDAGPKALFVEPLGGRVYVAGKRVKDTRQKVDPFIFITLGGTHLVIGPVDGKWPLLSAGDAPELEKEAPEPPPEAEGKPGESAPDTAAVPASASSSSATAGGGDDASSTPPKRAVAIFGVAFGLLLLTAWLILFNLWKGNHPLPGTQGENDLKARAEEVLRVHGASQNVKVESEGGRLYVRGYVVKADQLRDIEIDLRTKAIGVVPRIWSLETLAENARSVLRLQRLSLDVAATSDGRLVVSGSVTDRDLWNRVKQQLADEIPGVTGIDSQVTVPSIMKPSERTVIVTLPAPEVAEKPEKVDAPEYLTPTVPTIPSATATAIAPTVAATAAPGPASAPAPAPAQATAPEVMPSASSGISTLNGSGDKGTRPGVGRGSDRSIAGAEIEEPVTVGAVGGVTASANAIGVVKAPQPPPRPLFPTIDKPDATVESIQNRPGGLGSMRLSSGGIYFAGARLPFGGVVKQVGESRVIIKEGDGERTVGIGDLVRLGMTSGATSQGTEVNIAVVSDALRDTNPVTEPVSVRRALPATGAGFTPSSASAASGQAAPEAGRINKMAEPTLPTAETAPPAGKTPVKEVTTPAVADFQKPSQAERQKAKQEALEAAVAASGTAKPTQGNQTTASTAVSKDSKP